MRIFFILALVFFLVSCSGALGNMPNESLISNSLEGAWQGEIKEFTTKKLPDDDGSDTNEIVFLNCNGVPEVWLKSGGTNFNQIYDNYRVESKSGNYILSLIIDGGGWVETQTWTLVAINSNRASIQWNRMVSNRYLSENEELRSFGQLGHGELEKVASHCDIWESES